MGRARPSLGAFPCPAGVDSRGVGTWQRCHSAGLVRPGQAPTTATAQVAEVLRTTKCGMAARLFSANAETYELVLDDTEGVEFPAFAVNHVPHAPLASDVLDALASSRLMALRKPQSGVRGTATGDVLRRLVSRGPCTLLQKRV